MRPNEDAGQMHYVVLYILTCRLIAHVFFLQATFTDTMYIQQIATRRRHNFHQRVTQYSLRYSTDSIDGLIQIVETNGDVKLFSGNVDSNETPIVNELPEVIEARIVRLVVEDYQGFPALRWELYGCSAL